MEDLAGHSHFAKVNTSQKPLEMRGDDEPEPSEYLKVDKFNYNLRKVDQTSEASSFMMISNGTNDRK